MKRRAKKTNRDYFTSETDDAILLYNKTESSNQRSKIYSQHIHYPFFKLTQNIIHTFKFYNTDVEDLEHLQHEIIVFLLGKIHLYHHSKSIDDRLNKIINKKYNHISYEEYLENGGEPLILDSSSDPGFLVDKEISKDYPYYKHGDFLEYTNNADKITLDQIRTYIKRFEGKLDDECWGELKKLTPPKAYSYFGTIVKRWLINYNTKNYEKKINTSSIDTLSQNSDYVYYLDNNPLTLDQLSNFIDDYVEYVTENIYELFPKGNDPQYADAILDLFRKRDMIDIFNKKALYKNIRETAAVIGFDASTPKITKISDKLRLIFEESYLKYVENGYIDFES